MHKIQVALEKFCMVFFFFQFILSYCISLQGILLNRPAKTGTDGHYVATTAELNKGFYSKKMNIEAWVL